MNLAQEDQRWFVILSSLNHRVEELEFIEYRLLVSTFSNQKQSPHPPSTFFCQHFEELQTVLTEVKLVINNAPLTYVYTNTIKTYSIHNHLLFGRQLLYSFNTTSTVVRNLTVLSNTTDKINIKIYVVLDCARWKDA